MSLQQLRVSDHVAKRRPQVMRDRIGERFQFLVDHLEFRGAGAEFLIEFANFILSAPALLHLNLKVVAHATKIGFGSASDNKERDDDRRPYVENEKMSYISTGHVERVVGLRKKVVEAGRGQ